MDLRGATCPWPGLIPLEHELRERLIWFVRLRWLAVAGIMVGAWSATTFVVRDLSPMPLYIIGGAVAAYNGMLVFLSGRTVVRDPGTRTYRSLIYAQIGLDWIALSCLIHYAGGVPSPVPLAFAFHLIIGAILLSRRDCYILVGVAAMLLAGLIVLEQEGIWPAVHTRALPMELRCTPAGCLFRYLTLCVFLGVTAYLTTSIIVPLRRKEEALFESERSLEQAYAEVRALSEERAWFARVTHHQMRAPLAAARSMLDAIRYAGPLSDKQQELIARCRRRLDESLEMIGDLLELAAAQRPRGARSAEEVALRESLEEALETAAARAEAKGVVLEVTLPEEVAVMADERDVKRIFGNLLDNAVKYTPAGGRVRLRAQRDGEGVIVLVEDTGIGIAPEDQDRVFKGFYRTPAAKATGELGTGMGLSIVAQLVKRWGGSIHLDSQPGQGSRFTVRLPSAAS